MSLLSIMNFLNGLDTFTSSRFCRATLDRLKEKNCQDARDQAKKCHEDVLDSMAATGLTGALAAGLADGLYSYLSDLADKCDECLKKK